MNGQRSLTLRWRPLSWRGMECVPIWIPYKGGQSFDYIEKRQYRCCLARLARPKIVDPPLTLNFRMRQGVWGFLFCLWSQPILHRWMVSPDRQADYQWCKTKNRSHSVDAHFALGVSTICYHLFCCNISLMVFWQPLYHLHILSSSSKHCSLIIHINISFKIYFKVSVNCR